MPLSDSHFQYPSYIDCKVPIKVTGLQMPWPGLLRDSGLERVYALGRRPSGTQIRLPTERLDYGSKFPGQQAQAARLGMTGRLATGSNGTAHH
jgi:hypothetical protein